MNAGEPFPGSAVDSGRAPGRDADLASDGYIGQSAAAPIRTRHAEDLTPNGNPATT